MELYLIRHAHAVDAGEDPQRPLSPRGRRQVRMLARFLRRGRGFDPAEIWHSPLERSRETARLLARRLQTPATLHPTRGIEPDDDPGAVARRLRTIREPIAIVGHEPQLSALASLLVTGRAEPTAFVLRKCSALALEKAGTRWRVRWHVTPSLLGEK